MTDRSADRPQAASVRVEGVNLSYGTTHVLKDVELSIEPGEFFAFLGPSGCGKTTLLRLIAGFNIAQSGRVLVGSEDICTLPPWKRDVGMVFQSYALWPHMTVRQNVAFGLEERKVAKTEIAARVAEALDIVGMGGFADRYPAQLSGGQQQRVALARTIVVRPKVLLLDEPLSNLDAKLRVEVRRELRDLQQRLGITTIFVTHDQEEANTICDRIAVMNDGVIQQVGTPMELYERPANLFVAGFLGTANILDGRNVSDAEGSAFVLANGERLPIDAPDAASEGARAVFRPQHVQIARATPAGSGRAGLTGKVVHREFLGAMVRFAVDIAGQEILADAPFTGMRGLIEADEPVSIAIARENIRLLSS